MKKILQRSSSKDLRPEMHYKLAIIIIVIILKLQLEQRYTVVKYL